MGVAFRQSSGTAAYGRLLVTRTNTDLGAGAKITRMPTRAGPGWLITTQAGGRSAYSSQRL